MPTTDEETCFLFYVLDQLGGWDITSVATRRRTPKLKKAAKLEEFAQGGVLAWDDAAFPYAGKTSHCWQPIGGTPHDEQGTKTFQPFGCTAKDRVYPTKDKVINK